MTGIQDTETSHPSLENESRFPAYFAVGANVITPDLTARLDIADVDDHCGRRRQTRHYCFIVGE